MGADQDNSWRDRYEAAAARDREGNAAFARDRFGGGMGRFLRRELPWVVAVGLFGYLLVGGQWAVTNVAIFLAALLVFRAWARRKYGVTDVPPPTSPPA